MTTDVLERQAARPREKQKLTVIDCDIHPGFSGPNDLHPYLSERWREHMKTFGGLYRQPLADTLSHPRMQPEVSRRDAWPPGGGSPGSSLAFMREQHIDGNNL